MVGFGGVRICVRLKFDAVNLGAQPVGEFAFVPDRVKKKFRDTAVGVWLREKAPEVLDVVGDALPDKGVLGIVKNLVDKNPALTPDERMEFDRLERLERQHLETEITKRWVADSTADSWLAKNTRPLIVNSLVGMLFAFIVLDSLDIAFDVADKWIGLYEVLTITAVGGYFALRSLSDKKPTRK